ncbi:hypothetical protein MTX26_25925 [Bradyrhizobium sp. ISRA443]|uniref:hypothetical protein n=1 Tax=unclassified Bradyrhizobium TaxID=2631580 RepID=UPI00247A2430|nr:MULTISPECIES: hypothetical protein [unclassified Bradyrhizobium]WGR93269.1 hypothetical protein MTX20_36895 [Bradyrhizobium sp. ISRA435]WGR97797.1 hypothetical protein MTX23_25920 [Bradyrhizobium sp. ISRA436]WGS04686.1 hypothetical protein MTX18_25925 [Bradyrhizobium sp. ISRA437]WGS11567.1 hypothetical protein MTX26_25925 [Bradyrhizobium sp. ISRA443]
MSWLGQDEPTRRTLQEINVRRAAQGIGEAVDHRGASRRTAIAMPIFAFANAVPNHSQIA